MTGEKISRIKKWLTTATLDIFSDPYIIRGMSKQI